VYEALNQTMAYAANRHVRAVLFRDITQRRVVITYRRGTTYPILKGEEIQEGSQHD